MKLNGWALVTQSCETGFHLNEPAEGVDYKIHVLFNLDGRDLCELHCRHLTWFFCQMLLCQASELCKSVATRECREGD